jgi:hypothetical protein
VRGALAHLPWVDGKRIEINYQRQVRLTIKDVKKLDPARITTALRAKIGAAKVIQVGQ